MNSTINRTRKRSFRPTLNQMETRALLSTFGGGNIDSTIPHLATSAASLNFTSNTFHQINGAIPGVAQKIAAAPTNTNAVDSLLGSLMPRMPYGVSRLLPLLETDMDTFNTGSTPPSTADATASVDAMYTQLLGRMADPQGEADWVAAMQSGMTVAQVSTSMVQSAEFLSNNTTSGASAHDNNTQFVNALYENVLGRPAESSGLNWWVNMLDSGKISKNQVAADFMASSEAASSSTSVLANAALPAGLGSDYYYGSVAAGEPITGNYAGMGKATQIANLIQQDILAYLGNNIGVNFNVLKSHVHYASDNLLGYNGKV